MRPGVTPRTSSSRAIHRSLSRRTAAKKKIMSFCICKKPPACMNVKAAKKIMSFCICELACMNVSNIEMYNIVD